jgi:hypothetical protein
LLVVLFLENEFFFEGLVLFFEGLNLDRFLSGFGVHLNCLHLGDIDIFLELRLESLDEFVVADDFGFEGILKKLMVFDLLEGTEVLVFVRLVLFGGVVVLLVGIFKFLVHFKDVCFESDKLVDGDVFEVGEVFLFAEEQFDSGLELKNILFKFPGTIVPPTVSGEILGLEYNHPTAKYPIFFFKFFHHRPIIIVSLDGLVEFKDLLILVLYLNRVVLDVALTLIQLKLELCAFPLGLFFLKIVLLLQLNDLPAQGLHL